MSFLALYSNSSFATVVTPVGTVLYLFVLFGLGREGIPLKAQRAAG